MTEHIIYHWHCMAPRCPNQDVIGPENGELPAGWIFQLYKANHPGAQGHEEPGVVTGCSPEHAAEAVNSLLYPPKQLLEQTRDYPPDFT